MDGLGISNKMKMADSYELGEMKDTDQHFQANVKDAYRKSKLMLRLICLLEYSSFSKYINYVLCRYISRKSSE